MKQSEQIKQATALLEACEYFLHKWRYEYQMMPQPIKTGVLYHYTDLHVCSQILQSNDIYLFDSQSCNDIEEYKHGVEKVRQSFSGYSTDLFFRKSDFPEQSDYHLRYEYDKKSTNSLFKQLQEKYYVLNPNWLCYVFSLSRPKNLPPSSYDALLPEDNLSMWRGYGNDGNGCALSFAEDELYAISLATPELMLREVIYDDYEKDFFSKMLFRLIYEIWIFNNNASSTYSTDNLSRYGISLPISHSDITDIGALAFWMLPTFFKHHGFSEENETRLILVPSIHSKIDKSVNYIGTGHSARPYIKFSNVSRKDKKTLPVIGVCIGPNVSNQQYNDYFVKTGGHEIVTTHKLSITNSRLPYRSKPSNS